MCMCLRVQLTHEVEGFAAKAFDKGTLCVYVCVCMCVCVCACVCARGCVCASGYS